LRAGLAVAIVASAILAGCGELTAEEYQGEVAGILEPLFSELEEIGHEAATKRSAEELVPDLDRAAGAIDGAVDDLEGIDPPAELEEPHRALVDALSAFGAAVTSAGEAAQAGDEQAIATELPEAAREFQTRFAEVTEDYEAAGVEFGPPAAAPPMKR
jgi:hypothetical protein